MGKTKTNNKGVAVKNNFRRKKLNNYIGALVDTPFNRKVQERIAHWNSLLPKEVKLYGFQDEQSTSNTIVITAMATKYCQKNLIGGDSKRLEMPKDTISNYLGIGMNGEVASGYKFLLESLESNMIKYMEKKQWN